MTFGVRRASSSAPSVSVPPHWPKPCSSSASGSNAKRPEQENPNRGRHATASSICNSAIRVRSMRNLIGYGFLAPPNILIVLCITGALLSLVWRRVGTIMVLVSSFSLYVLATPAFSSCLLWYIESKIPESDNLNIAQAIVVLGVDVHCGASITPERLGLQSLERLVMAAEAYHHLRLPIAV